MEYADILKKYGPASDGERIRETVAVASDATESLISPDMLRLCYSCLDLTSLNVTDSVTSISEFVSKVVGQRSEFPDMPDVASVCVYPSFVETVGIGLGDSEIKITSVAGGFPSAQTFLEVKMLEAAMAVENGADEIDVVLNVGEVISGGFDAAGSELEIMREEIGSDVVLKVIIESGILGSSDIVRKAALAAMLAGADFVKTSTGKVSVGATPEAAVVICEAIRDFYEETGVKVGFKVAGGVRTVAEVAQYYSIVKHILGAEWLTPALFRIGASSAANSLLSAITGRSVVYY